jgi:spore coat polysaccharide biosynthesis protein SpsF
MKTAVFIPVRLDSTRLPRKALLDIMGKPVIQHLVERLKLAKSPDVIVICTSTETIDDPLLSVAEASGALLFRGNKADILERYRQAALEHQVDLIINVDGDDILIDPEQVDAVADALGRTGADLIKCEGLPFGAAPLGLRCDALLRLCETKEESDTATGWSMFFTKQDRFKIETLKINDAELHYPEIRMTLDYPEDYEFFTAIFRELYRPGRPVRLRDAIGLLVSRPDIRAINSGLEERYWAHFNANLSSSLRSS